MALDEVLVSTMTPMPSSGSSMHSVWNPSMPPLCSASRCSRYRPISQPSP
jgi:hypothetical protein